MLDRLFTNELEAFSIRRRPKALVNIMLWWAIFESLISVGMLTFGEGAWWNWLGFLCWILYGITYKLYKNNVSYGMTTQQLSTWDALRELSPQTQAKLSIDKEMIKAFSHDECIAVRSSLWELQRTERENIKVANTYQDRRKVLTASIESVTMDIKQSTETMRELMSNDYDDIDHALAEAESVSKA